MYLVTAIVLAVAVPTVAILYMVAWKYRASNDQATYKAKAHDGKYFVFSIWAVPTIAMLLLAVILVPVTHRLDPKKQVGSDKAPITIQVIALRWKWLFLYPEQQIATVNTLTIPKDQPVTFELTADDAPMSSFWIPNLAGQLYAMTGHVNHLNVVANEVGNYPGSSAEINGDGFADMKFNARVTTDQEFNTWVNQVRATSGTLDTAAYSGLVKPSENHIVENYSTYADDLYNKVIMKYLGEHSSHKSHQKQEALSL